MIKIENVEVMGWEAAIRGMRNPMNSWDKSDSGCYPIGEHSCGVEIGDNDHQLMMNLAHGGPVHAKYRRMITVYLDITAPLYWWKEFDTYKVGTVANSCSTMHKIHAKEFEWSDFSCEHLRTSAMGVLEKVISSLNTYRRMYLNWNNEDVLIRRAFDNDRKNVWWQMIQLLPTSYNQKRTVMLSYEVLVNMHDSRKNHKLDEWRDFCKWIESLPYSELITGEKEEE